MEAKKQRLTELDALRGIAALAVVFCHFFTYCRHCGRTSIDFQWGSYGPHLFFILSGFVILMTLQRCGKGSEFAFSRFTRLYPLYWMAVLISASLVNLWHPQGYSATVPQIIANLTMLQTWLNVADIEVSYWTLGVELKFYLLMFILLCFKQTRRIELLCIVWLVAILGYRLADQLIGLPGVLATPLILDYAHLFIAGMMFFRIKNSGSNLLRHSLILIALPMALLAEGTETMLFTALFIGAFYLFINGRLGWIANRQLVFLGSISYALYLVHGSIGAVMIAWLNSYAMPVWVMLLFPLFVSIVVSWILTRHFEQPAIASLRTWFKGDGRQVAPSAKGLPESA
jgi:peptidoglycan/LPS O-acetylase OafA/YrhL